MRREGSKTVEYPRLRCPFCQGWRVVTTGTKWPMRSHRCLEDGCGETFQSFDRGPKVTGGSRWNQEEGE